MTEQQPIVFVIDDDASVRDGITDLLRSVGVRVESFGSVQEFLQSKRADAPGCIVLDVRLPGTSGLEFQFSAHTGRIKYPASSHIHQWLWGHFDFGSSNEIWGHGVSHQTLA
jgi:FixJ family two-component response regulator